MQYIILNSEKAATHKFKDGKGAKTWNEVKEFDNVAMIVPEGYVVLDFDTVSDAEIMMRIVDGENLKCRVMKTTRGIHCWFKASPDIVEKQGVHVEVPPKNFIKNRLAVGIYADRKAGGRNAYVKIKDNGKMREWLRTPKMNDLETVPEWLRVVSSPLDKFRFKGMGDGSGRNQELFNYIVYLQSKKMSREVIRQVINIINKYVFDEPLDDYEIETICRDEAFKSDEEIAEQIEANEKRLDGFSHNEFGDELIDTYNIITVNNQMYVYEDGFYQQDDRIIEKKMIELFPAIKERQRNEVLKYIKIQTHVNSADLTVNPYVINLKNTRLNIKTGDCLPFTPEAIEFDRVPVVYNPAAYCADVDKTLNRVFLGDGDIIKLFEEMVGACLVKKALYGKAFILYGSGANGKSTILDMVKKFIGIRNYSAVSLEDLCRRPFAVAELEHKLANIGDDIDNALIKDSGTLKRIFDGNSSQVERKGERPFTLEPYATHIFSANAIPHSYDKSDGFYRRWCIVPFQAKFTPDSDDYDPMLIDKLTTPEAMSYLLNLALRGVQRLLKRGAFTEPKSVKALLDEYKVDNSTVLTWLDDTGKNDDVDYFLETSDREIFLHYRDWCNLNGVTKPSAAVSFYRDIAKHFGFESKRKQKGDGKRYFVVKL